MKTENVRWFDPVIALCYLALMYIIADHLVMTEWTDGLEVFPGLVLIGVVLGFMLGFSRFRRWTVFYFALIFTAFFITWKLLNFTDPTLSYNARILELGQRLWNLILLFFRNEPPTDSLLFLANMATQYWLVAFLGAYWIVRHGNALVPLIFALILEIMLDLNHYGTGRSGISTAVIVGLAAIIIAKLSFMQRNYQWKEDAIKVEADAPSAFFRSSTVLIILFVFVSWMLSSYVQRLPKSGNDVNYFTTLFQDIRKRFENAANPLRGGIPVPTENFGSTFALGSGSELSDNIALTVETNMRSVKEQPYYWRVRSYDNYADGIWSNTVNDGETLIVNDEKLTQPKFEERTLVRFTFFPRKNLTMLYAPGILYRVTEPVFIYREKVEGTIVDIPVVTVPTILTSGSRYEIASFIGSPNEKQLREAGSEYPAWVLEKYLQLPDNFPPQIHELAVQITADAETNYDKTLAITDWLRANIAYQRTIPSPPANKDPVYWVLFEQKEGFCNYYAAAEVLMLRSIGIPARWVVGYAQGDYSPKDRTFSVKESDAHAWPEVFFPEYGWLEFEPTASEDVFVRDSGEPKAATTKPIPTPIQDLANRDDMGDEDPRDQQQTTRSSLLLVRLRQPKNLAILGFILAWSMLLVFYNRQRNLPRERKLPVVLQHEMKKRGWSIPNFLRQWADYEKLLPVEKEFLTIRRINKFLKLPAIDSTTALEHINLLTNKLPATTEPAGVLLNEFHAEVYGHSAADMALVHQSIQSILREAMKYGFNRLLNRN